MRRATFVEMLQSLAPCECDDDMTANGHALTCPYGKVVDRLSDSDARQRAEIRRLRAAVRVFPEAYPDGKWRHLLHEDGCPGVRLTPKARGVAR